jgi:hypothetical protein
MFFSELTPSSGSPEADGSVHLSIYAMGFVSEKIDVPVPMGETTRRDVILRPVDGGEGVRPVLFEARLPSGLPVDGCVLFGVEGGPGPLGLLGVRFKNGVAESELPMPIGRHELVPFSGSDRRTCAYDPASHPVLRFDVPGGEGAVRIPLVLQGDLLELDVRSPDGKVVRGYDVKVRGHGIRGGSWHEEWDGDWCGRGVPNIEDRPELLLPPGDLTICVDLPGVGGASGVLRGDGLGRRYVLTLTLDGAQEFNFRSQLEAIERHRKWLSETKGAAESR